MKKSCLVLMAVGCSIALIACGKDNVGDKQPETEITQDAEVKSDSTEQNQEQASDDSKQESADEDNTATDSSDTTGKKDKKAELLSSMVGDWGYYTNNGNVAGDVSLSVTEDGKFTMEMYAYGDELYYGGNPVDEITCNYSGELQFEEYGEGYFVKFGISETNDENLQGLESAGDFYIDRIDHSEYEGEGRIIYLTQLNNGDSVISYYFWDMRPVFYETVSQEERAQQSGAVYYCVENPSYDYYYNGQTQVKQELSLSAVSSEKNQVTDYAEWFSMIGEEQTYGYWYDDEYYYQLGGQLNYMYTTLEVYDKEAGTLLYVIDMSNYASGTEYGNTGFEDCANQGIRYAVKVNDVLYISTSHRTYFDACPQTGYITAIDLTNGEVMWKTQAGVCNSDTFAVIGDEIVCGYGFTNEPDYLYIISAVNGEVFEKIGVKTSPDYIYYRNDENKLYVRCYDMNYVYETVTK